MSETLSSLTLEQETRIEAAIAGLYRETDVPPPSFSCPIAPLGPLLRRMAVRCVEIPGLTLQSAETYLKGRRVIRADFDLEGDRGTPLAGFLYAAGTGAFLFIDSKNPVTRRRFSIAHEIGHLLLHFRPLLLAAEARLMAGETVDSALYDAFSAHAANRSEETGARAPGATATAPGAYNPGVTDTYDQREREADAFAAALLLPSALALQRFAVLRETSPTISGDGIVERLAMDSLVSREAMRRRIATLGLKNAQNEKRREIHTAHEAKEDYVHAKAR